MSKFPELRKLGIGKRQDLINSIYPGSLEAIDKDLADVMVENAIGYMEVPMGIVQNVVVNGKSYDIPMATEEPSVIAAAQFGARSLNLAGGINVTATEPLMIGQIFFESKHPDDHLKISAIETEIQAHSMVLLSSMTARGGGWQWMKCSSVNSDIICVEICVDTRDAMGANLLNSLMEKTAQFIVQQTGLMKIMAILSNTGEYRKVKASIKIPLNKLRRRGIDSELLAKRLEQASVIAQLNSNRAITNNKGIMNGVSALALATGNDTRALEAAVHAFASRDGQYRGLSQYKMNEHCLDISLEMPVPLAIVGGAASYHPRAQFALEVLGVSSAVELGQIAGALGLIQNFAALSALVAEGIQEGHMGLHAKRIAYSAGARGEDIQRLSQEIIKSGKFNAENAESLYKDLRGNK